MLDFVQKRKVRHIMYHKGTLIVLGLLVLLVLHSTWVIFQKKQESERLKNAALANVTELQTRDESLQAQIDRLQTPQGVEEEVRSKFNVAKDNEQMVVVVPNSDQDSSTTSEKTGFWAKIWQIFSK